MDIQERHGELMDVLVFEPRQNITEKERLATRSLRDINILRVGSGPMRHPKKESDKRDFPLPTIRCNRPKRRHRTLPTRRVPVNILRSSEVVNDPINPALTP